MSARSRVPSYRHHKPSGQAVVTVSGKDVYLGPHGANVSRDEYDRVIGEWLAAGRTVRDDEDNGGFTVLHLVDGFDTARVIPASHAHDYRTVMKQMLRLYGRTAAADFGPLALKSLRQRWEADGLSLSTINGRVDKVRRIVRWGVEHELVDANVLHALKAVRSLTPATSAARPPRRVRAADLDAVQGLLDAMLSMLAAMVQFQLLTGMRPGEMLALRTCDVDTRAAVWVYRPAQHKTMRFGKTREVAIGPRAIDLLRPWLLPDLQAYVFSPGRNVADQAAVRQAARKTPMSCGNRPGRRYMNDGRSGRRGRTFGSRYTTQSYRQAIERVIDRASSPPAPLTRAAGETEAAWKVRLGPKWPELLAWRRENRWTPHQLRHAFGQMVRDRFGLGSV